MQDGKDQKRDTPLRSFAMSDPSATVTTMHIDDWSAEDCQRVLIQGDMEIRMHPDGKQAIVTYPWWKDPEDITDIITIAQRMGFDDVTEQGYLDGYGIPEVDCSDWDYVVLEAKESESSTNA